MVILQKRSKHDSCEFDFEDILGRSLVALVIIAVLYALFLLIGGLSLAEDRSEHKTQNEHAAIFNQLPAEERKQLAPMLSYTLDDDNKIPVKDEEGLTFKELALGMGLLAFVILYVISAFLVLYSYCESKRKRYFLADFPREPISLVVILLTLPLLPVYLISGIRMLIWAIRGHKEEQEEVKKAAIEEIHYEQPYRPLDGKQANKAQSLYVRYVTHDRVAGYNYSRDSLTKHIDELKEELERNSELVRRGRRDLAEARNQLEKLQLESEDENLARAKREWEQIRQMRGVSSLSTSKTRGKKLNRLLIGVRVRVPYKGELYDFGDYRIEIEGTDFRAVRTRSGIKANATSSSSDYNESGGFCFGDRRYQIRDYVRAGRLLEAITLMIDSLHSVNSEWAEEEIPHCFRKVRQIEKAKAKILAQEVAK